MMQKKENNAKILSNMVKAVRVIRLKGDIRIPVLGHFCKIKYMPSIK